MLAATKPISSAPLILAIAVLLTNCAWAQTQPLTARQVVARIQQQVGVPWQSDTVDTFKTG